MMQRTDRKKYRKTTILYIMMMYKEIVRQRIMIVLLVILLYAVLVVGANKLNNTKLHKVNTGEEFLCEEVLCAKGTQPQVCARNQPQTTKCVPCPVGTFRRTKTFSSFMLECEQHNPCAVKGLFVAQKGTATTDNVCECDLKANYRSPFPRDEGGDKYCYRCLAGECVVRDTTTSTGTSQISPSTFATSAVNDSAQLTSAGSSSLEPSTFVSTLHSTVITSRRAPQSATTFRKLTVTNSTLDNKKIVIGAIFGIFLFLLALGVGYGIRYMKNRRKIIASTDPALDPLRRPAGVEESGEAQPFICQETRQDDLTVPKQISVRISNNS